MTVAEFILQLADRALASMRSNGAMPAGRNGPYGDTETPVRNTSHWLVTFSAAHRLAGDDRWLKAVDRAARYLASSEARPGGGAFLHRTNAGKDPANGLIGQAWTFEALVEASNALQETRFVQLARDVFRQHDFRARDGLWNRLGLDGSRQRLDGNLNHQLWFAAASARLEDELAVNRARSFLDQLPRNITVVEGGLIYHPIVRPIEIKTRARRLANSVGRMIPGLSARLEQRMARERAHLVSKSIGYHAFCTYALGSLRQSLPEHSWWNSPTSRQIAAYLGSAVYVEGIRREETFGFPYNAPGFEVPVSLAWLSGVGGEQLRHATSTWLNQQLELTYNKESGRFDRNTADPVTLTARIYELTRLPLDVLKNVLL